MGLVTSHPNGTRLLLKGPWSNILLTNLTALIGVGVLPREYTAG